MGILHYDYPNAESVVVCGDIHGLFEEAVYNACVRYKMTKTLVIVAGDCGFGFKKSNRYFYDLYMDKLKKRLEKANCWMVFVRGNHDDPIYFNGKFGIERFRTVPDYSVITACGHQILCVGGAISIDRLWRTEGKDYWTDEEPVFLPPLLDDINDNFRIDTVITHCAPSFCFPIGISKDVRKSVLKDETLLADLHADRDIMDKILERLQQGGHPLRHWFYGHYHCSYFAEIGGINYNLLRILEMKEIR